MAESTNGAARPRGPGRPFSKGVSGNPGGRPRIIAEVRDLARAHTQTAIRALVAVLEQGQSDAARVAAAQALLDRGWGRPVQALEVERKGPPGDLSRLSDGSRRWSRCWAAPRCRAAAESNQVSFGHPRLDT